MKRTAIILVCIAACRRAPPPPSPADAKPGETSVELTPEGLATADIHTQRIAPGSFSPRLRLAGTITGDPRHIAEVGARVAGRVSAVRVALGDSVRRGQDLVEVEAVELHQVTLEYETALAKVRAARDTVVRQKQLVDERVGALQELRRAESEAAVSEAALVEAKEHLRFLGLSEAEVERIRSGVSGGEGRSRIASPIDGRVAALGISLGQVLTGGETIATIADLDAVWASVRVYERDLTDLRVGTPATIEVPTYPNRTFEGSVSFISDVLDPGSRSAEARIMVANSETALRPGMSATVRVARQGAAPGLWLPVEAVQSHENAWIVFVRTGERRFEPRRVIAGGEQGGFVPVTGGIGADDDIVVHGAFALRGALERAALGE